MEDISLLFDEICEHQYEAYLHELHWLDRWYPRDIEPPSSTIVLLSDKKYGSKEHESSSEDMLGMSLEKSIWYLRCESKCKYPNQNIHEMPLEIKIIITLCELPESYHTFGNRI